jgi:hypothetical protein
MLREINLQDKRLTELEAVALAKMLSKREQYVQQGRAREAHGAGTAIWILWSTLTGGRNIVTTWGDL